MVVLAVTSAQRLNITELWIAFWYSEELPIFTGPRDGQRTGSGPLCYFANVLRLHWLWRGVMFWKQGQTLCMGHVDCLWRSHTSFCALAATPEKTTDTNVRHKTLMLTPTVYLYVVCSFKIWGKFDLKAAIFINGGSWSWRRSYVTKWK